MMTIWNETCSSLFPMRLARMTTLQMMMMMMVIVIMMTPVPQTCHLSLFYGPVLVLT